VKKARLPRLHCALLGLLPLLAPRPAAENRGAKPLLLPTAGGAGGLTGHCRMEKERTRRRLP
jgi:hypothetical protein